MAEEGAGLQHQPFDTFVSRIGREGLQLNKPLDQLTPDELSRMANLYTTGADLVTRLGQTVLATAVGTIHAIRRLNDPQNSTYTRFWGGGAAWYRGQSGVLSSLEVGFSGNPLTLVPVRPPFSGESWMIAADSLKMRKASRTSNSLPVGLPAPTGLVTAIAEIDTTRIATFDGSDSTQAASWTGFGGYDTAQVGVAAAPTLTDVAGLSGSAVALTTNQGGATAPYLSMMAIPKVLNLSKLQGGTIDASDDDIVHIWVRMAVPSAVAEIRVYLVVGAFSLTSSIPGTSDTENTAAYMRAYRPSDYAGFVATLDTAAEAAEAARQTALLNRPWLTGTEDDIAILTDASNPASPGLVGAGTWTEYGRIGLPVRRGDFVKIGTAGQPGTDWSTVTGIYITVQTTTATVPAVVSFDDCFLIGGAGPDTTEPGAQQLDYRVVNYDPRTGARSNGTAIQAETLWLDSIRSPVAITPTAYTDPAVRQEAYRRGGSLVDNWYFVGVNTANGGEIVDRFADADLINADTLPTDHFQPVATVDASGNTVLNQPVPVVFGPFDDGTLCALGDPYRPGYLYACIAGEPDHWPSTGAFAIEVCAPSEQLMNGCVWGGQGFVLSRERGYSVHTNLAGGDGISSQPTACQPGLAGRWGFCTGPGGIFYVAKDGIRVTQGNESQIVDDALWPLFHGMTVNGYAPIDFSVETALRLSIHDTDLWFLFQDTNGTRQCFIYSLAYRYWRTYSFTKVVAVAYSDEDTSENAGTGMLRLLFGSTNATAYTHSGYTDDGTAIPFSCRTGSWDFQQPRQEKLLGDLILDADLQGVSISVQTRLNVDTVDNTAQTVSGAAGRKRYTFDPFGVNPQHARTVSVDISGSAPAAAQVTLSQLGISRTLEPDVTMNRVTTWQTLNAQGESYLMGCWIDSDTGGTARTIFVEGLLGGATVAIATLTVTSANGRRQWFSWPAVHVDQVRLRPSGACQPWILFGQDWIHQPEPARIATWDTNFETLGDSYYTGVDLEVDTFNVAKTLAFQVDGVTVATQTVTANGRTFVHITLPPGRGHIYRISATDAHVGLFYTHKWITTAEPGEQTNWNAGYTLWASLSDKYLKGFVLEADTFNQVKSVNVEADGVVVATVTPVQHNGRLVKNYTFPQVLGRVFRVIPTDNFPSRLYTLLPLFDEEPYQLARWESQLMDFDLPGSGWGSILSADVCYKAAVSCTLTVQVYNSFGALVTTLTNALPSTGGAKQKAFVPVTFNKGVLFKLLFTTDDASAGLTLYQEESRLKVKPWDASESLLKPFGNDDLGTTRNMRSAVVAANRSGGGS